MFRSKTSSNAKRFSRYVSLNFKNRGRDFNGVDCWGLIKLVLEREYSLEVPDYRISCTNTIGIDSKIREEMPFWEKLDAPEEPCLIAFRFSTHDQSICNHVGLYIGEGEFIHALKQHGITITRLDHFYYKQRIEGYYGIRRK